MKKIQLLVMLFCTVCLLNLTAQERDAGARSRQSSQSLTKPAGIINRAQNVITINKLGQTVTNLGQFYPYSGTLPAGRWPLGTDHDQIYKMNLYVGIPNNVISTRARNAKEWDGMAGYFNPDSGKVALSTDPQTWPRDGAGKPYWPVRTQDNRDSIVSQQDSYAVFRDSTNMRAAGDPNQRLNIEIHQSSYAWSTSKDEDYIIFKFEVINDTSVAKDSLYFGMYTDFDAGGMDNDYEDDLWGLELARNLVYIYDADGLSLDWPDSKPFCLGLTFLETPLVNGQRLGITDWHYSSDKDSPYGDILSEDPILFQWLSSHPALRDNPEWPNLFHGNNIHYDDVGLIPATGLRLDAIVASGPYHMEPFEKITFILALVAGQDYADLSQNVDRAFEIYRNGLRLVPPPQPEIQGYARDSVVRLTWSNGPEFSYADPATGISLVQEYRIYKTTDPYRKAWGEPVAIVPRDTTLTGIKADAYLWQDPAPVTNYFYYSYAVTTYDRDGLESGIANLGADQVVNLNTAELRPVNAARTNLNDVKVVPNPYVISAGWERKRLGDPLLGEPIRDIAFINLPERCQIKIFTFDGDLVRTLDHDNATGTEFWDLRSDYNQMLATGIYFFHVQSAGGEKVGKFAIVR